jgi:hypothetical protein
MRIQFAEIRNIKVEDVLAHYGVETRKRSTTELVANCPFPSHKETEHKNGNPTLCISLELNRWFCQSSKCREISNKPKGGDCIDVVAMMENLTPLDAAKKLAELFGGNPQSRPNTVRADTPHPLQSRILPSPSR